MENKNVVWFAFGATLIAIEKAFAYLKSLRWLVLFGIAAFCIALAIVNNLRVDDSKSVDWIGTQDIMEKPAEVL